MSESKTRFFKLPKRNSNFLKSLNYVVTSDYDQSYLLKEKVRKLNMLKWVYLFFILFAIAMSFVPLLIGDLAIKNKPLLILLNLIIFIIFSVDYCLRWITYIYRANKKTKYPILFFPFTGVSLIMIFTIFPSFLTLFAPLINWSTNEVFNDITNILSSLTILQLGRLILLLNVVPIFRIFTNIFVKQRKILIYVFMFLILVTLLFGVIIFRAEVVANDKINTYWDAYYFTVISICTIGYGDIYPVTDLGKFMVIILAFSGVAIFTIPGAVIAGGFLEEIHNKKEREREREIEKEKHREEKRGISIAEKTLLKTFDGVKKVVKSHKVVNNDAKPPTKSPKKEKVKKSKLNKS
ncbi:MAG: two pore domain potassium channel family protein [Mycoplasmataceae bacterium]|nr:two pore domain potassium channel family protein [Mycoplasmataceae bacterium]